ncbi:hypothetical protein B0T22DRAFT_116597 [Podospora appendiculata]|uniref:Uncharacterized protein n=1 Tax=Podospora appendiculata TaxID=314037 RepID=A0AAE1CIP0_9PEZI|nr:hypothetical protein B0T22DRAFT_116597 [Podospora appendiculata]
MLPTHRTPMCRPRICVRPGDSRLRAKRIQSSLRSSITPACRTVPASVDLIHPISSLSWYIDLGPDTTNPKAQAWGVRSKVPRAPRVPQVPTLGCRLTAYQVRMYSTLSCAAPPPLLQVGAIPHPGRGGDGLDPCEKILCTRPGTPARLIPLAPLAAFAIMQKLPPLRGISALRPGLGVLLIFLHVELACESVAWMPVLCTSVPMILPSEQSMLGTVGSRP